MMRALVNGEDLDSCFSLYVYLSSGQLVTSLLTTSSAIEPALLELRSTS